MKRIAVLGIQPPSTTLNGLPTSRRNTSPPYASLLLTESLRKEASRRGEKGVLLVMQRGPRAERGETGYETIAVDASEGKVLLHETLPAAGETRKFFGGEILVERTSVDLKLTSEMLSDLGAESLAVSSPWSSGLSDIMRLRALMQDCRMVLGGSGIFNGFAKALSAHPDTYVVIGPGFGNAELDSRLYSLLSSDSPRIPRFSFSESNVPVLTLITESENRSPLEKLQRLAEKGKANEGFLRLPIAFRAFGDSLFPYLGQNIPTSEFTSFLSRFERTEGDRSLAEDSPMAYMQLSYGCPRECEYCTSPSLRRGQSGMSKEGIDETLLRISNIIEREMSARISIWDENPLPKDVLSFLERFYAIAKKAVSPQGKRRLQIEFTNGFYPSLWEKCISSLKPAMEDFRKNMGQHGIEASIGAFFPAENWGYGGIKFYENKSDTYDAMQKGRMAGVLSLFDYAGTTAGMDNSIVDEGVFASYLAHLKSGWPLFRQSLGENCVLAPFFTQVFPNTALSTSQFTIFGERITPAMLEDEKHAMAIADLYSFGENFASPAFQASTSGQFLELLGRFYEVWEEINGPESAALRKKYGLSISPSTARLFAKP